ncbi:MAG TPA: hydrogenase maturation protease [Candidatus Paceibacterota bacterium]|nr:hydrogenase maturation protease [Candidatus Paceibacterota bacterium]
MSQTENQRRDILVIGYGNTLRSDDGVGPGVADAVSALNLPGVRVITCHQLTPELASDVSQTREVIFVDASVEPVPRLQMRRLEPAAASQILAHAADPKTLLALARDVFGHCPTAWWLTIPIRNMDFGERLSDEAAEGLRAAVRMIETLAADCPAGAKYAKT